jgi:hypothetical protein
VPASGATVSNLEAITDNAMTGAQTATVEVVDNTTGSTVLSCTIDTTTSLSTTACRNTASATVSAGHYLQVRITTGGSPANAKWRVLFRF